MQSDIVLSKLNTARLALEEAKTIQETKKILDVAAAAEIYAKRQQLGEEAILYATSIKIEALRQLGNMLKNTPRNEGGRPPETGTNSAPVFPTLADMGLDKKTSKLAQDIAALPEKKIDAIKAGIVSLGKAVSNHHISDDSFDWYSPVECVNSARSLMGSIDIDPASSELAQEKIQAEKYFTAKTDGLTKTWKGNVWLNPPYSMPEIELFVEKVINEYAAGNVKQAIVLTNNSTDTKWFHLLAQYPFCLTSGRLQFWNGAGEILAARQGQAIFYLGNKIQEFKKEFSQYGIVVGRL